MGGEAGGGLVWIPGPSKVTHPQEKTHNCRVLPEEPEILFPQGTPQPGGPAPRKTSPQGISFEHQWSLITGDLQDLGK